MNIRLREAGNTVILDMVGNIDINACAIIETTGVLMRRNKNKVIFNLKNVNMVDYSGLSILAIAYKNIVNHNGKVKFININLPVMNLLAITKLADVFDICIDEKSALEALSPKAKKKEDSHFRRRFQRLRMNVRTKFSMAGIPKADREIFESNEVNISGDGLFLHTYELFPIGAKLNIDMELYAGDKELSIVGIVIWHADKILQPHCYPGMGVRFMELTSKDQSAIVGYIEKNLTSRSRKV